LYVTDVLDWAGIKKKVNACQKQKMVESSTKSIKEGEETET